MTISMEKATCAYLEMQRHLLFRFPERMHKVVNIAILTGDEVTAKLLVDEYSQQVPPSQLPKLQKLAGAA